MKYLSFSYTHCPERKINHDSLICIHGNYAVLSVISDGFGSSVHEKIASKLVVNAFEKWFYSYTDSVMDANRIRSDWEKLITEVHQAIRAYNRDHYLTNTGCTMSAMLLMNSGSYLIAHIGDTRIYRIRNTSINQLTRDHTFVSREIMLGRMSPEQALTDGRRHVVLQLLGYSDRVSPDFEEGCACIGDSFLLCSKGLWLHLSNSDLEKLQSAKSAGDESILQNTWEQLCQQNRNSDIKFDASGVLIYALSENHSQENEKAMPTTISSSSDSYVFISYSHKDMQQLYQIRSLFDRSGVRYWYDDGLHFGEDWNLSIATHLQNATVCLLLLSPNSASSEYVKNELNFAISHRINVYTLLLSSFTLPPDIELMTSRIQTTEMTANYEHKILKVLPVEVFRPSQEPNCTSREYNHPLYQMGREYLDRQGTKTYLGKHIKLNYPCAIQKDHLKSGDEHEFQTLAIYASNLSHPMFPRIYDIVIENGTVWTYQEYRSEQFLDQYLQNHRLTEIQILNWISQVVDAMAYLFARNLGFRDFSRGSLVVTDGDNIGMFRLQNLYHGVIKLHSETKQYYFEKEIQEIAVLLVQLCTGSIPLIPLRMIEDPKFSRKFRDKINLIIQKCTKEKGIIRYSNFEQIKTDLEADNVSFSDNLFLSARRKKLIKYDTAIKQREAWFTTHNDWEHVANTAPINISAEEEFGFEETALLNKTDLLDLPSHQETVEIRIQIYPTGQIFEFSKKEILIGRSPKLCDFVWKQPFFNRVHMKITKKTDNRYTVTDMNSTNGSYVSSIDSPNISTPLQPNLPTDVPPGTVIRIGQSRFIILPIR